MIDLTFVSTTRGWSQQRMLPRHLWTGVAIHISAPQRLMLLCSLLWVLLSSSAFCSNAVMCPHYLVGSMLLDSTCPTGNDVALKEPHYCLANHRWPWPCLSVVIVQNVFNFVKSLRRQMLRKQPEHATNDTATCKGWQC